MEILPEVVVQGWESVSTCSLTVLPDTHSLTELYSFLHASSSLRPTLREELELRICCTVHPSDCRPDCSLST